MSWYNNGAKAARKGRDPSPPKYSILDPLFGGNRETTEKAAKEYKEGYAAGSQQRVADNASKRR